MLFNLYGSTAITQLLGWVCVFAALILLNEVGRRSFAGGMVIFVIIPVILTVYFILAYCGMFGGAENLTVKYMSGWFHYFKLYAADIGCVGFILIKHKKGIGAKEWFKPFPFFIVAANIMIANVSDMESFIHSVKCGAVNGAWWCSNEGVFLYGGWWNLLNAIAGLINIFCMTGWWGIYSGKNKKGGVQDMLWPDMTVWFIVSYDVWNFTYTYLNLPTHSWYCGVALLLAPTFANAYWNKGGWIQNRANTLAIWCMFAQVVPTFQLSKNFSVLPSVYAGAVGGQDTGLTLYNEAIAIYNQSQELGLSADKINTMATDSLAAMGIHANPTAQGVMAILALVSNVIVITAIIKRSIEQKKNPYTNDIWVGTRDYELAMARKLD